MPESALRALSAALLTLMLAAGPAGADENDARPEVLLKDLIEQMKAEDPGTRAEAAGAACEQTDPSLTAPLIKLLRDDDRNVRLEAMKALSTRALAKDRKRAANAIAQRLPKLEKASKDETLAAIAALHALAQPDQIKGLISSIDKDDDEEIVKAKLMAVANVSNSEAIERLIQFLAKGRRGDLRKQRSAAASALQYATGQRLGQDPDRWRAWWREVEDDFDFAAVADARDEAAAKKAERSDRKKKKRDGRKGRRRKKDGGETDDA